MTSTQNLIAETKAFYNIAEWGDGYFSISAQGHLLVKPQGSNSQTAIDLAELLQSLQQDNQLSLPLIIRFTNILQHRAKQLSQAFSKACKRHNYDGDYTPVYPIKVNQQRAVVEALLQTPKVNMGLEAGSKPELLAIMALAPANTTVICNGYKDRAYIRLALMSQQLGLNTVLVIEKHSELAVILRESKALNIKPNIGVRVRLASLGKGKWQNTGGEKAKFGLYAAQLIELIEQLKGQKALSYLSLMHCHLGSQLANIHDIQRGVNELSRLYIEFNRLGVNIDTIDLGGGLGVDYEGSASRNYCSMNYSLEEYANAIVSVIKQNCEAAQMATPNLITESGRALTAHHAVFITDIIDCEKPAAISHSKANVTEQSHSLLQRLATLEKNISGKNAIERHHDASFILGEIQALFNQGHLSLTERADAETLYSNICLKIKQKLKPDYRHHRALLDDLNERLADKLFCNFSIFQSLPDIWAIDQIFPIMPITRLNEPLERRAILQDITCDSDGTIKQYVDEFGLEASLALPKDDAKKPYHLAIFLTGAYQETLGDIHNLFADPNAVHIHVNNNGSYEITEAVNGESISDVLQAVQYQPEALTAAYVAKVEHSDQITTKQKQLYLKEINQALQADTYLK